MLVTRLSCGEGGTDLNTVNIAKWTRTAFEGLSVIQVLVLLPLLTVLAQGPAPLPFISLSSYYMNLVNRG